MSNMEKLFNEKLVTKFIILNLKYRTNSKRLSITTTTIQWSKQIQNDKYFRQKNIIGKQIKYLENSFKLVISKSSNITLKSALSISSVYIKKQIYIDIYYWYVSFILIMICNVTYIFA